MTAETRPAIRKRHEGGSPVVAEQPLGARGNDFVEQRIEVREHDR